MTENTSNLVISPCISVVWICILIPFCLLHRNNDFLGAAFILNFPLRIFNSVCYWPNWQ